MSDVAFLLLIFIMLVALISQRAEGPIDRAEARFAVQTDADRNLEIWIDRDGGLHLDGRRASLPEVEDAVAAAHVGSPETRVHVVADRDTAYRHVSAVLEMLQILEYRAVSLVVRSVE